MVDDIVEYLERLVLIEFGDKERQRISREIGKIMDMFSALNAVEDLDKWEPLYHVHDISMPLRSDEEVGAVDEEREMLKSNSVLVEGYVKAPKTIIE